MRGDFAACRRRVSFPAMGKKPKDRRGTAQDERFALIFALPPVPHLQGPPMRRCSTNAKARVAQLNGFSPITAPAELSVAFGDCFYRWKARLLGGWGSSSAQGIGGRVRAPAPTQMQELSLLFVGAGPRPARGRPHGAAPTKYGELSGLSVGADDLGGPRAHNVRPYGGKRTGRVGSVWPGAAVERHQGQILQTQGPVARREFRASLRFCAPEILLGLAGMRPP